MPDRDKTAGILAEVYALLLQIAARAESPQDTQTPCGKQGASGRGPSDGDIIADPFEA